MPACLHVSSFFFYTSNMASASETPPPSEEVAECGSLKRKRGAGRGGAGAKYCSMSPWQRKEQFPDEPFEVRISDNNEEYLFCTCCGKPVSHQQETFVQSHVVNKGHQQARKTWKLREQKRAERASEPPVQSCCTLRVQEGRLRHRNFSAIFPQFSAIFRNFSAIFPQFFAIGFDPPRPQFFPPPLPHTGHGRRFPPGDPPAPLLLLHFPRFFPTPLRLLLQPLLFLGGDGL